MAESGHICNNRGDFNQLPYHRSCGCSKLATTDWLKDIPGAGNFNDIIEVRFKNTRKGYYRNVHNIRFKSGDVVAVEASPGHDIGIVSLTGELVLHQLQKYGISKDSEDLKKLYRKAKPADIDKWKDWRCGIPGG